jgi:sugar lactone lactonase YvrE
MKSAPLFSPSALLLASIALISATAPAQTTAPTTQVGSTSPVQTATLTFTENATVASINVLTQGAPNLDFQFVTGGTCTVGTAYTTGQTCTVKYTFCPTHPGPRYGAVALYVNSSPAKAAASTYLQGIGNGPQIAFNVNSIAELGTGFSNSNGIGLDGNENVILADTGNNAVKEIVAAGGYTSVVTLGSGINTPTGLAVDGAGNVFVGDGASNEVKEIVAAGGYQTVLTLATFAVLAVAVDRSGNLFLSDGSSLWEMPAASGYTTKTELCGTSANPCSPISIALDGSGNVYFADDSFAYHRIRKILAAGGYTTIKIIGPYFPRPFKGNSPGGVAVDANDNVFVTYNDNSGTEWLVETFAANGYTTSQIEAAYPGLATQLALDGSGNIYFLVVNATRVWKFAVNQPANITFGATAAGTTSTNSPESFSVTNNGNKPLNFSGVSYGPDFPEAAGFATDCTPSTSLGINGSCTLSIDFSPLRTSATGPSTPLNELVTLTNNNLNVASAEQFVAVSGTETFTPPALTTPTPGTVIGSSSATFSWSRGSATTFQFRLGTTLGSNNLYGSGQTNATSETVSGLPTAVTIYARLYYLLDNTWKSLDYTYPGSTTEPSLTSPTPGSTLSGSTVTFSWNPGSATTFRLRLGTTLGSNNIYGSGQTTKTSETVSSLPTNGETIHARLCYIASGTWQFNDYTYTAK